MRVTEEVLRELVFGGGLLGGGGGGCLDEGLKLGQLALQIGTPRVIRLEDLQSKQLVATVALVGAPAAAGARVRPVDYWRSLQLLLECSQPPPAGIITNECGSVACVNGLVQSALSGLPVVDAPCNGRAHPTGMMGAMGLHRRPGYLSLQAAAGGDPDSGRYLELVVRGSLATAAAVIRAAAIQAGGLVAVARNPVEAVWVGQHGAPGALRMARELGRLMLTAGTPKEKAEQVAHRLGGDCWGPASMRDYRIQTRGGFDVGWLELEREGLTAQIHFCNEYLVLEMQQRRLATFPDLIATIDAETGRPVTSCEVKDKTVWLVWAPARSLALGSGMKDPELFRPLENAIGTSLVQYVFGMEGGQQ